MKTYFTSGLAIRQRNIVYRSFNHFLILSIQNLNSLHDYLHSGPCPSVSTVQFESAPVIRNPDTNISTGTMNINPKAPFTFFTPKSVLDGILHRYLY